MKRVLTIAALTAAVSFLLVGGAFAGTQDGAVIALHAKGHTTKATSQCTTWAPTIACSAYTKTYAVGANCDVYLVVAKAMNVAKGIAGMSCGIDYNPTLVAGVDVFGWKLCADLEFTNAGVNGEWPAAGGGNRITWVMTTNCQQTVRGTEGIHAIAGAFYVYAYSPDQLRVTNNNNLEIPELAVADCTAATSYLPMNGSVSGVIGFGMEGYNPCTDMVPVKNTTWGKVKSQF